ncbi:uncharacterized protein PF3D7_1120000-like [Mytilus edulis]|uniref:uncharacterized protein PF3D7_1120000-like n=1 Tax=Mytilus edulis TaxID=6550 RepID=UPI0039EF1380
MVVDQDYQDEEMFSQSEQKEKTLESDIDMVEREIKRKNERIIELELMLEEKQDWFNLKSQMVKKLEGELNYVHARHPERFTFDDDGTSLVPKSLEQTLKDLEREEREETFRTKYMPVYHKETEIFRKRGKYPTNVPYFNEVSMASEFLKKKYLEAFGECFSFDYKKKSFPLKQDPISRKHIRPSQSSFIQREGNRKFLVSGHLGETELLPAVTEACDLERFSEIPANKSLTGLDDLKVMYAIENLTRDKNSEYDEDCDWKNMTSINIAYELKLDKQVNFNEIRKKCGDTPIKLGIMTNESVEKNWGQGGESLNMWRTRPKLGRPNSPRPSNDKKQADRANVVELINGNNQFNTVRGTAKKLPTETLKEHGLKKSLSMESVFVGDGTKMRPHFKWRMGDECVSLEKYINVYTRNPEELYEAVKKRAIEKEEEEDYEENVLYHEEIKASLIGIDETKMKSNLRILDKFLREEEEKEKKKAKSTLKQVNTENCDEAIDSTLNEEVRAEKEKTVLQQDQTGSCYEDIDATDEVGVEKKMKTSFDIIEEIKASIIGTDKAKIKSNLRILDNLIREEEEKEKAKLELKQVHTENADQAAVDVTGNDKMSDEKEKIVLPPDQTGSCCEDTDGANDVGFEKKINTCFDIIFEKPKKRMSKPKLSSEKRKTANLMPNVIDQNIKRNENKEDVKLEKKKVNTSFDIMFEKPKKHTSKPKLSSGKRKTFNLMANITDQNIKSNENTEDVKLEEKKVNTTFDIMFDGPKKKRTKPKLTSGGRKAKFQLKRSNDEKKDKSHDNEQKEDATTADSQVVVENVEKEHTLKANVSFDVFFDSQKKLKPKPKLSFINRKKENETKSKSDVSEVLKEEKHEKLPIVPSKTTEDKLSNGGKLGGKFTYGKLGRKFTSDVIRKNDNEIRFRFSILHGTTIIPSRIPVMVRRFDEQNMSLTGLNNEQPHFRSARNIPVRIMRLTKTNKATITCPLAVRSFPESKIPVRRGIDIKINSTGNAKSPIGDDRRSPRKRERGTKLPRITRKSRIPVRIKGFVWKTNESEDKRKTDESRRLLAPLSRIPIPKDKIRRPSDCIIPRLDPNEHLPQIFHSSSKREEQVKFPETNRILVSGTPMTIGEKGERTYPEFLQLPSVMGTLPPIVGRSDTYVNRPLSASGLKKLPPIKSTSKTTEMERPMSSVRLSPLFTAFENTETRPLSAIGSPKVPPIIDGNTFEMYRPSSSLSGYALLPPIPSYKRGSVEDDKVPVEESNRSRGN